MWEQGRALVLLNYTALSAAIVITLEGTFARVFTIATSVVGITVARLLLDPFGL